MAYPVGLGADEPPAGFVFPDQNEYLQGIVGATAAMAPTVTAPPGSSLDSVLPPVKIQITGLKMVLENASGMPLNNLSDAALSVVDLANATDAVEVAAAVTNLLGASLEVAVDIAEAVGAATSVISTVPVLGQIVGAFGGLLLGVLGAEAKYAAAAAACQKRVDGEINSMCSKLVSQANALPTSPDGKSPADLFRPAAYRWKSNSHLPLSPASIYIALCADQVQNWSLISNGMGKDLFEAPKHGSHHLAGKNKIPKDVRRQMWMLCRGLMQSVREPTMKIGVWYPSDHGRSLFPILQSIVLQQIYNGNITEDYIDELGRSIATVYRISKDCPDLVPSGPAAGAMPYGAGNCADRVDLGASFKAGIIPFKAALEEEFMVDGVWQTTPKTKLVGTPKGVLMLGKKASQQLVNDQQSIVQSILAESYYPTFSQLRIWQKALLAAGTAGAGYLGFEAVRKWA